MRTLISTTALLCTSLFSVDAASAQSGKDSIGVLEVAFRAAAPSFGRGQARVVLDLTRRIAIPSRRAKPSPEVSQKLASAIALPLAGLPDLLTCDSAGRCDPLPETTIVSFEEPVFTAGRATVTIAVQRSWQAVRARPSGYAIRVELGQVDGKWVTQRVLRVEP